MKERIIYQRRVINYTSHTKFVDITTGEAITRKKAETNYIKIKTTKHVTFNLNKTKAVVEYTTTCQKDLRLFEN